MSSHSEHLSIPQNCSFLIVMLGAIGDVVRAFPLAARIKKHIPGAHITWAVETSSASIVRSCSHVDRVVEFKRSGGFSAFRSFIKEVRQHHYDISLDIQRHLKSGVISYASRAAVRVGFNYKNSRELNWLFNNHEIEAVDHFEDKIEQVLRFGNFLNLPKIDGPYDFGLSVSDEQKKNVIEKLRNINLSYDFSSKNHVLLLVGSVWETKRWSPEYYARLAEQIYYENGMISAIVGAPHEKDIASAILDTSKVPMINLVGHTTLDDFRVLCTLARAAVGSDSGPMHIASAMGLKVVSLWGPTSPTRSKPYQNIDYAIQSPIGCQGCYLRHCPDLKKLCLKEIRPEIVYHMFQRAIQ